MNGIDVAKMVQGRLAHAADLLEAHQNEKVSKEQLIQALRDPWVCTLSPNDPGVWRWYNTETGEWGDECNP